MSGVIGASEGAKSLQTLHEALKIVATGFNVHGDRFLLNIGVRTDHHDVGRRSEFVDECDELLVADNH